MNKLSKFERFKLINQLRILESLYPDEADDLSKKREIFENGYEYLYDVALEFIYDGSDVMSSEECKEVWDTLDMFDSIDRSIKAQGLLHDDARGSKFRGYDGNNEGKFLGFVEFTILRERRWTYLPLAEENYFNSHMQTRPVYQRMLERWESIPRKDKFPMSLSDLNEVLDAAIYPDSRETQP